MKRCLMAWCLAVAASGAWFVSCEAATPVTLYVNTTGYDGNSGLSAATAFSSVTRACQEIQLRDGMETDPIRVVIGAGTYPATVMSLESIATLASVEWEGDTLGAGFGTVGDVRVLDAGTQSVLCRVSGNSSPVTLRNLSFASSASTVLLDLIRVENNTDQVRFMNCKAELSNPLAGGVKLVLMVSNSPLAVFDSCQFLANNPAGVSLQSLLLQQSSQVTLTGCRFESLNPSGGNPLNMASARTSPPARLRAAAWIWAAAGNSCRSGVWPPVCCAPAKAGKATRPRARYA